jgi:hypothetical protein
MMFGGEACDEVEPASLARLQAVSRQSAVIRRKENMFGGIFE